MRSQRARSRLFPQDLASVMQERMMQGTVHERQVDHDATPQQLIYTSKATLDLVASVPLYVRRGGQVVGMRLGVTGAPTGTLTCDLLDNGVSMFQASSKPTIETGVLYGHWRPTDRTSFQEDDYLQVQLTDTGTATGPMTVIIEYLPGAF